MYLNCIGALIGKLLLVQAHEDFKRLATQELILTWKEILLYSFLTKWPIFSLCTSWQDPTPIAPKCLLLFI